MSSAPPQAVPVLLGMLEQGAHVEEVCAALGKIADPSALLALLPVVLAGTPARARAAGRSVAQTLGRAEDAARPAEVRDAAVRTMEQVVNAPPDGMSGFFARAALARLGAPLDASRLRAALGTKLSGDQLDGVAAFLTTRKSSKP